MMLNTRLILVEGLPGSGKSTIGQLLGTQIQKKHMNTEWFSEGDIGHPIDWDAVIDEESFNPDEYMKLRMEKWKNLADKINCSDTVTVLESSMFQIPINELLFNNAEDASIMKHISSVLDVIKCLNPVLIYFYQHDVEEAVKRACRFKGESWTNRVSQAIAGTRFGKSRNLQGYDGMVQYFTARSKLEYSIFSIAGINKLWIENSASDWGAYRTQIFNHLQLDKCPDRKDEGSLLPFTGTFYNDKLKCTFEFAAENGVLMDKRTGLAMVLKEEGIFYLPGLPTELIFQKNSLGAIDKMIIGGRENMYIFRNGTIFEKVNSGGK